MFSAAVRRRHQVEGLEHEADLLAAHPCLIGLGQNGDVVAVQFVAPAVGAVEQADDVEQGGLAGNPTAP